MKVLEVKGVSKYYAKRRALDNISFSISEGEIVGFVGPNGAGKTTTMKIIIDFLNMDSGEVIICGTNLKEKREEALGYMSAIIETPNFYNFLSGWDNLNFVRKINKVSMEKMQEIIELIGLQDRIKDKVKKYSLGMKQRLGLGICLLTSPKLLILDEPTNGLDPTGTIEFRKLLLELCKKEKISVLISSHILSELEKTCDRIIFIKEGQIIEDIDQGSKEILNIVKFSVKDTKASEEVLKKCSYIESYKLIDSEFKIVLKNEEVNNLIKYLVLNDLEYYDLEIIKSSLENEYENIVGGVK